MKIEDKKTAAALFRHLAEEGMVSAEQLYQAAQAATARSVGIERVLNKECGVPRERLLSALSRYYGCPSVSYDERMPIPAELLAGLDGERLSLSGWFPIIRHGDVVVVAANDPESSQVRDEVQHYFPSARCEFRVALDDDIQWYIQDFLHAPVGRLIGTERTGLAFWRNTMAHWRTRLACYRTDLAKGRTDLALLRWGLGLVAIGNTLLHAGSGSRLLPPPLLMAVGAVIALFGLRGYLAIRRSRISPPGHQTIVEVTAATMHFLEAYHFIEGSGAQLPSKRTMLGRLGDFLADHCTILYPSPASRERTHLARERNVLAGQRTVTACYRTIYARARTGLAFIRTGVTLASLGAGLIRYFGFGYLSIIDALLVTAGTGMIVDGLLWYLPARREESSMPRCPVPEP